MINTVQKSKVSPYPKEKRTRIANDDLHFTLIINGRAYAAYRDRVAIEELANALSKDDAVHTWEIVTQ